MNPAYPYDPNNPNAIPPTNAYPQPVMAPVAYVPQIVPVSVPVSQNKVVPTQDLLDFFGFAHTVKILATIQCVSMCLSIVGLIFLCIPCAGMAFTEFRKKDYKCYYWVTLICFCLSIPGYISIITEPSLILYAIISLAINVWWFYVVMKAYSLYQKFENTYTPEQLHEAYIEQGSPCKMF